MQITTYATMDHGLEIRFEGITEQDFYNRSDSHISVLSGTNNCGKSLILKMLFERFGESSFLCGTNRYYEIEHFGVLNDAPDFVSQTWSNLKNQINDARYNRDPVVMPFHEVFIRLTDAERSSVLEICSEYLGAPMRLEFVSPGNSMSPSFLTIDGTPIAKCSSGSRLLVYLVSILMTKKFGFILIDEPELGLTPRIQNALQHLAFDCFDDQLSHLQHLYIATHSHIFLNRRRVADNFLVLREEKVVRVRRLSRYSEFRELQFNQLGNSFDQLQLPAGFMIIEGKTDFRFLNRLVQSRLPNNRVNIVQANGDGQVKNKLHDLLELIGGLQTSPYCNRVLVVLDSTHSATLASDLSRMGLRNEDVFKWKKNGIEYYYPLEILRGIFCDHSLTTADIEIADDSVSHNGIHEKKAELCEAVLERMTGSDVFDTEVEELLERVKSFG